MPTCPPSTGRPTTSESVSHVVAAAAVAAVWRTNKTKGVGVLLQFSKTELSLSERTEYDTCIWIVVSSTVLLLLCWIPTLSSSFREEDAFSADPFVPYRCMFVRLDVQISSSNFARLV